MKRRPHPFHVRTYPSGERVWCADITDPLEGRLRLSLRIPALSGADVLVCDPLPPRLLLQLQRALDLELAARRDRLESRPLHPSLDRVIAYKGETRNPLTQREYKRVLELFAAFCDRRHIHDLADLSPELIAGYAAEQISRGRKPSGVNSDLTQLRSALNLLDGWGLMPKTYRARHWFSPARLRQPEKRWRIINDLELKALLADSVMGDLFAWLYLSGQRVGVVLQLHRACIGVDVVTYPPGKHGRIHTQQLTPQLRELLSRLGGTVNNYLFWQPKWGNPSNPDHLAGARNCVRQRLRHVLIAAGFAADDLPRVHDLRATCANTLLRLGLDPLAVAAYTGWEDIRTFYRHYYRQQAQDLSIPTLPIAVAQTLLSADSMPVSDLPRSAATSVRAAAAKQGRP